ncbi:cation efflux family-domain-containing protein [Gautieria morchelliformis]|nr:cation efflux family-domain-containing protein [Gautieria morchelliformis]
MEAHVDPRTRTKVTLIPGRILTSSIPTHLLTQLVLSNLSFVFVLISGKEWILDVHVSPLWLAVRVLGCGSMGALVWAIAGSGGSTNDIEWSTLGGASSLIVIQQVAIYMALQRMSAVRTLMLIQSSPFMLHALMNPAATRRFIVTLMALVLCILSSTSFSLHEFSRAFPSYFALLLYALSTNALETTWRHMEPVLGKGLAYSATMGGAFILSLFLYALGRSTSLVSEAPILSLSAFLPIPFIAASLLYASPHTSRAVRNMAPPSYSFLLSFSSTAAFAMVFGYLAFHQPFSLVDVVVASLLVYGSIIDETGMAVKTPGISRLARAYLKTILSNPESRKIFYFLMLNLSYMGVQVVYGVITNSLGLISDAIHMAFDCMAIAMGLFASVAATWIPNEQYTYGYGRIETLSGFANGIFLLLISIFIVFEAIQRLLDPPEMNTNRLLLVSTLGLGVNLFGMFAMGGHHHHHGHSHSHGATSHEHDTETPDDHHHSHSTGAHSHSQFQHTHDEDHDSHTHVHSHSRPLTPVHHHSHPVSPVPTHKRTQSRMDALNIPDLHASVPTSPITPGYRFGQDDHFAEHHHSHHIPNSHDHSHHPVVHEGHSHNMRGVFLHVMADTLGSVGVIISTLLIQFYGWTGFDPIASLFIAVLIAASVIPLVIDSGRVLALDVGAQDDGIRHALNELAHVEGVESYTQPRFWPKDASSLVGSIHIQLQPAAASVDPTGPHTSKGMAYTNVDRVLERVDTLLRSSIKGLEELTIQIEGARSR